MKNKFLTTLILTVLMVFPVAIIAQTPPSGMPTEAPNVDFMVALNNITNWLFIILMIVAVIAIIIAAYLFVTAAGDPDKTGKARNFVLYALIGVLVAFLAKGLVMFVGKITGAM